MSNVGRSGDAINPASVRIIAFVALLGVTTGCANENLLFASATTFGLKIAVAPEQPQPITLAVGYDQYDASIVPVTTSEDRKVIFAEQRLCKSKDAEARECTNLFPANDAADGADHGQNSELGTAQQQTGAENVVTSGSGTNTGSGGSGSTATNSPIVIGVATTGPGAATVLAGAGIGGADYRREPPTTLSIFDANGGADASATTSASFGIGKLFATGIAAQNISEGVGYERAKKGTENFKKCLSELSQRATTLTVTQLIEACSAIAP